MQRWGLPLLACGAEHPLPGLSVPVPGHCCLNGSWLAIWTGKCAKGWHERGWTVGAPLFHTVERNITGKKVIRVGDRESNMSARTCIQKKKDEWTSCVSQVAVKFGRHERSWKSSRSVAMFLPLVWCMTDDVWHHDFTPHLTAKWQIVTGKRNKWRRGSTWCWLAFQNVTSHDGAGSIETRDENLWF